MKVEIKITLENEVDEVKLENLKERLKSWKVTRKDNVVKLKGQFDYANK